MYSSQYLKLNHPVIYFEIMILSKKKKSLSLAVFIVYCFIIIVLHILFQLIYKITCEEGYFKDEVGQEMISLGSQCQFVEKKEFNLYSDFELLALTTLQNCFH